MRDHSMSYTLKRGLGVTGISLFLLFALFPIIWVLILSVRPSTALFDPIWENLGDWSLENFGSLIRSNFPLGILNSFITAGGATLISMLVGIPAGFALAKSRFAGKFIASWLLLLLRMAPPVGFVIPLFLFYLQVGFIDSYPGLIFAYMTLTLPLVVWLMWNSFAQLPNELIEAAIMDGASIRNTLLLVALPAAKPGVIAAFILGFLLAWNDFFFALVITRQDTATATVAVMNFISYDSVDWGAIGLASIVLTLPILPFMVIANKYIVRSISGAVKG